MMMTIIMMMKLTMIIITIFWPIIKNKVTFPLAGREGEVVSSRALRQVVFCRRQGITGLFFCIFSATFSQGKLSGSGGKF